ncbi:MAG: hypothetical protein M3R64_00710 [Pseudomonadota bacterium]|nr:hypothetical protein [Pseudomonadota bacterium]
MPDTDATAMTDADINAASGAHQAASLKDAHSNFDHTKDADANDTHANDEGGTLGAKTAEAKQAIKDGASKYSAQATDKIRSLADTGKAKAGSGLNQVSKLIDDAATQVDERLGQQYGDYARSAASQLSAFSGQIEQKNVEELLDDARSFVRKSPAVAIGIAAAVGFALARVIQSGIDTNKG